MLDVVEIYTDGSLRGNPKTGGWAFLIIAPFMFLGKAGYTEIATNNTEEIRSAIMALEHLPQTSKPVVLYSDSQYVIKSMTEWWKGWAKNGFVTASKKPVKNLEMLKKLRKLVQKHNVQMKWVKGHNGNPRNELVDKMAGKAADTKTNFTYVEVEKNGVSR